MVDKRLVSVQKKKSATGNSLYPFIILSLVWQPKVDQDPMSQADRVRPDQYSIQERSEENEGGLNIDSRYE
jgi:hypothetical protein